MNPTIKLQENGTVTVTDTETTTTLSKATVDEICRLVADNRMRKILYDGKFATILKPETITRAEEEKRYDVKITD